MLTRAIRLLTWMTDADPLDGLKANIEYFSNLNEDSFQKYLSIENDILLTKGSTVRISFDRFREKLEKAKQTSKTFLGAFDKVVQLIPDIESLIITVDDLALSVRNCLETKLHVNYYVFLSFLLSYENLLNDLLSSIPTLLGNSNFYRIFILFI